MATGGNIAQSTCKASETIALGAGGSPPTPFQSLIGNRMRERKCMCYTGQNGQGEVLYGRNQSVYMGRRKGLVGRVDPPRACRSLGWENTWSSPRDKTNINPREGRYGSLAHLLNIRAGVFAGPSSGAGPTHGFQGGSLRLDSGWERSCDACMTT